MRSWLAVVALAACGSHATGDGADASKGSDSRTIDTPISIDADLNAPTDVPVVACTNTMQDIYAATAIVGKPLGAILACMPDVVLDQADVQSAIGSGVTATTSVAQFLIAYQTRDSNGQPAVSTARVYLPHTPRSRPVPLAVAAHGTEGLADMCAPSMAADNSLPMPFAARGMAAIAPDDAGLGNAGTQDYLDSHAQGYQLLDAARALRALLSPGITAEQVILSGYSQGGGAVLSAQALANGDGPGVGTIVATVPYAPEWPISMATFDYLGMLDDPTQLTITTGLSYSSVAVLREYAFFENHVGVGHGKDAVPAQFQGTIDGAVNGNCLVAFGAYVQLEMLHTGDLIDNTLRTGVLACVAALGPDAGCEGNAAAYYNALVNEPLTPDPTAGPVLLVQGNGDLIMPPAQNASCIHDKLASAGVNVSACVFAGSDHTTIMAQHGTGETWSEAMLDGQAAPACPETTQLPACSN